MHRYQPNIGDFAQPCPMTISPKASAKRALSLMQERGFQYLPVQEGDQVVGLLSGARLRTALAFSGKAHPLVSDLMLRRPAVVSPQASLYEVLDETPDHVGGFTVLQDENGKVTGIFTPNDAVFAFQSLLRSKRGQSKAAVA